MVGMAGVVVSCVVLMGITVAPGGPSELGLDDERENKTKPPTAKAMKANPSPIRIGKIGEEARRPPRAP